MPDLPAHLPTGASARRLAGRLGAAALLLASLSCRDAVAPAPRPVQPEVPEAIDCASHGTDHSGSVESDTWKRNGSPHRLHGAVTVTGSLTIEPGSIVCGSTGSQLLVGTAATGSHGVLLARGTVDAPIVFTASDSAVRWGGILLADSAADRVSVLVHAVLQHATRGILADGAVQVDSSRFRQLTGAAVSTVNGRIAFSLVDTSGAPGQAAVQLLRGSFERTTIRGARGDGLALSDSVLVLGGRIEGSAGTGLVAREQYFTPQWKLIPAGRVSGGVPVRIVGSGEYAVRIGLTSLLGGWPRPTDQDSLLGNARDTLRLVYEPGVEYGDATVRASLPWVIQAATFGPRRTLRVEPGGSVEGWLAFRGGGLQAVGTAARPVHLSGGTLQFDETGTDSSRIAYAVLDGESIVSAPTQALALDHVQARAGQFDFGGGVRITASEFDRPGQPDPGIRLGWEGSRFEASAVRGAGGTGLLVAGTSVQVSGCEVTESRGAGITVTGIWAVVRGCNLESNAGPGLVGQASRTVDARGNWWGSPQGPGGPGGDGVSGDVDVSQPLAGPAAFGTPPSTVRIVAAGATVPTSDTLRIDASAFDAAGNPLRAQRFTWRLSDSTVLRYDATLGLAVGLRPGTSTVTAIARSDSTRRASATVTVTAGAPVLRLELWPTSHSSALWVSSPTDVFLGGPSGILHFDGRSWAWMDVPLTGGASVLDGTGRDNLYAVANFGYIWRFDGRSWSALPRLEPPRLFDAVAALSPDSAFVAAQDTIWLVTGGQWRVQAVLPEVLQPAGFMPTMRLAHGPDGPVAVRESQERLFYVLQGGSWKPHSTRYPVASICGGPSELVVVERGSSAGTGEGTTIERFGTGGVLRTSESAEWYYEASCQDPGNVYLLGEVGHLGWIDASGQVRTVYTGQPWTLSYPRPSHRIWAVGDAVYVLANDILYRGTASSWTAAAGTFTPAVRSP